MKKLLLLPALLVIISTVSSAQVKGGLKAGANYSFYQFKGVPYYEEEASGKFGGFAGIFLTIPINEKLFFRPELLGSAKGWREKEGHYGFSYNINLYYLSLPLLAGYNASPKIKILVGPELGYLVHRDYKDDIFNLFDAGLSGGVSYQLFKKLELEARYNHGFTNLMEWTDHPDVYSYPNRRIFKGGKNRTIQVSLAYQLKAK